MTINCPNCSHGFGWPKLEKTGQSNPEYKCPSCHTLFNADGTEWEDETVIEIEEEPYDWSNYGGV